MTQTYEQSIHAYKANEARRKQLLDFEDSLQWADRELPTPRFYPDTRPRFSLWKAVISGALSMRP